MPSNDSLTVLTSRGPLLTKRWTAEGIQPYDRAKNFTVSGVPVDDIKGLSLALEDLHGVPRACVIRGEWTGTGDVDGFTTRDLDHFEEQPRHWVCLDVDGWEMPIGMDLGAHAAEAVEHFVREALPAEFQGTSYHWQLSSSAGKPGAEHLLKAHVWFWLSEPRSGSELEAWARALKLPVDVTVFRTVQVHYTAAPIFDDGIADPIPVRSGYHEGLLGDEVDLVMPDLDQLPVASRAARGALSDPRDKTGLHGAFCRLYPPARVIDEDLCEGHFEWENEDSDVRITWKTSASGSPGGVCVTDDGLHFFNSHNDDPFAGRACNAWDFVRQHRYGGLDVDLDQDTLDFMRTAGGAPSERAMREWARALPDVADELAEAAPAERRERAETTASAASQVVDARAQALADALATIAASSTVQHLETVVAVRLAGVDDWLDTERAALAQALQSRAKDLGVKLPIAEVRQWLAPAVTSTGLLTNADGRPLGTIENVLSVAAQNGITIRYNTMSKEHEILIAGQGFTTDNRANASLAQLYSLCKGLDMKINAGELKSFICTIGDRNQYSPPLTWIQSKPWDGADRLQAWYDTLQGPAEKRKLKEMLMRRWALQMVAILHNTGQTMARGVLVLQGVQYAGKTRWFKSLAPEGMVGTGLLLDTSNKDSIKAAIRFWIVELGELDGTMRRSDLAHLKSFISQQVDVYRAPYMPAESELPRRSGFGGSVNGESFLRDSTGDTRLWAVAVDGVNPDHGIDMQQLWAQVLQLWQAGEHHWLTPDELAMLNTSNEDHAVIDPLEERLRARLPWDDPDAKWIEVTATKVAELAQMPHLSNVELGRLGDVVAKINGGRRRRTKAGRLLAVPVTDQVGFG